MRLVLCGVRIATATGHHRFAAAESVQRTALVTPPGQALKSRTLFATWLHHGGVRGRRTGVAVALRTGQEGRH